MDYRLLNGQVDVRTVLRYVAVLRRVPSERRSLCCATCGLPITSESEAIRIEGSHTHYCRNPQGLTFYVGCFRDVEGCEPLGTPTLDWTWFAGHRWQAVCCQRCNTHLGWVFMDGARFWALTLQRLAACRGAGMRGSD